ncbi:MAG: hypothetical protein GX601_18625 [Anaerolineales bacterium]|nr:hypothetical protein [Anaerolineales bacterium]
MDSDSGAESKVESQTALLGLAPYNLKWLEYHDTVAPRAIDTHLSRAYDGTGDLYSAAFVFWQCVEEPKGINVGALRAFSLEYSSDPSVADTVARYFDSCKKLYGPLWEQILQAPGRQELAPEHFLEWSTSPARRDARSVLLLGAAVLTVARGKREGASSASSPELSQQLADVADIALRAASTLSSTQFLPLEPGAVLPCYYLGSQLRTVGKDEIALSLSTALAIVERESARQGARSGDFGQALALSISAYRRLLSAGVLYPLVNDSIVDAAGEDRDERDAWISELPRMSLSRETLADLQGEVIQLSEQLSHELELRLLGGIEPPEWLLSEIDNWARLELTPDRLSPSDPRRDVSAVRSAVERKTSPGAARPGGIPDLKDSLALQMLLWATGECGVDPFDVTGLAGRLERDPDDRPAAAGIFWPCQCLCENGLVTLDAPGSPDPLNWDDIMRLLLSKDWWEGALLLHFHQLSHPGDEPVLSAGRYLDWSEPLTRRDPCVAVMYGSGVISLMLTQAKARAGESGALRYSEDLGYVRNAVLMQVARTWDEVASFRSGDDGRAYYAAIANEIWGDDAISEGDRLALSLSSARRLAEVEFAFMETALHGPAAGFARVCVPVSSMIDEGTFMEGLFVAHLGGPFATRDGSAGFDHMRSWFEAMLASPDTVSDWEQVEGDCHELSDFLSQDMEKRRSVQWDDDMFPEYEWAVPAWEEQAWAYWVQAAVRASTKMSPDQFARLQQRERDDRLRVRLQTDFLYDVWDLMETRSQAAVLTAESIWSEGHAKGLRTESVFNEWRIALEEELRGCLAPARELIQRPILKGLLPNGDRLRSRGFDGLTLGDIGRILRFLGSDTGEALEMQSVLAEAGLESRDRGLLTGKRVTDFVADLIAERNLAEHEGRSTTSIIAYHRRDLLGIDRPGILPAIVRMKAKVRGAGG